MTDPRTVPTAPPSDMWDGDAWEDLLTGIREQNVVPIVGPDLVVVEVDGVTDTLERFVARHLLGALPWAGGRPEPGATLNAVASSFIRLTADPERQRKTISREIERYLKEAKFPTPKPLRQLAEITPLKLFVNLTFDDLLEQTLLQRRFEGESHQFQSYIYSPNRADDIELTSEAMQKTRVYNLLGRVSTSRPYALTEEDLLEHVRYFQSEPTRPKNLFDELNRSNLLFLGEGYADWLARFFMRTTKNSPLSWQRPVREYVADTRAGRDAGLVGFLRSVSRATQLSPKGAVEFVDELHQRWSASAQPAAAPRQWRQPPRGAVFISYTRPDLASARSLKQALETAGVTTWFDEDQLELGDPWLERIEEYIKRQAVLFVPILSDATEERLKGKFRREWLCALERNKDHTGSGLPYIVPVGLERTSFQAVPPVFRDADIKIHDGGEGTQRIVRNIAELVAQWREAGG